MADTARPDTKSLLSKVINLNQLVGYQEGAVVSRTVLDKKPGTVTLFSFDKGEGLSEHTAPYDALVYLIDGEADIIVSGVTHRVKAGEMLIMPAGEPHELRAAEPFKMMLVMIRA